MGFSVIYSLLSLSGRETVTISGAFQLKQVVKKTPTEIDGGQARREGC